MPRLRKLKTMLERMQQTHSMREEERSKSMSDWERKSQGSAIKSDEAWEEESLRQQIEEYKERAKKRKKMD